MTTDALRAEVAAYYDDFARDWARGTSPLYEEWAAGLAADAELIDRIAGLPPRMRQANLLFAAARWQSAPEADYETWREWLIAHWGEVVETASARATQTNEPNRCATLLPPLSRIPGPIALLEVGTAAGLCLFPDRYGYDYTTPSGAQRLDPDAGRSAVDLACLLDDEASMPSRMPEVVWRRGIDLNPIDVGDAEALDWLATLVWPGPDHEPRVRRLRAAAAVAASDPPSIVRGDLREVLVDVAAEAPEEATLVLFHTAVLLYLERADREAFAERARGLSTTLGRPVVWLSNEGRGVFSAIDAALPAGIDTSARFIQSVNGGPVALAGQHGAVYETRPVT